MNQWLSAPLEPLTFYCAGNYVPRAFASRKAVFTRVS